MQITKAKINNCFFLKFAKKKDNRGFFLRIFCKNILKKKINFNIKQINIAYNKEKFTLRGFHFQKSKSKEKKIMICLSGSALVQVIDINKKSSTYKKKIKYILSDKKSNGLIVSENCANAYLTLSKNTKILYFMDNFYDKKQSFGFKYNDNFFKIKWPVKPRAISKKDSLLKNFIDD